MRNFRDNSPYVINPTTNEIKTENEMKKEIEANTVDPNNPKQVRKFIHENSNSVNENIIKAMVKYDEANPDDFTASYDPTTKLFTNKTRDIAFKDYNQAKKWNESIGIKRKTITNGVKPPKPFNSYDKTTYPSNQKNTMSTWDQLVDDAIKNPKDPNSKQTRKTLLKEYNNPKNKKYLGKKELKLINQDKPVEPIKIEIKPIPIPKFEPAPTDPQMAEAERRFNQIVEETKQEKIRNATTGIGGLLGGVDFER